MAAYNGLLEKQSSLTWNSHLINFVSFISFLFFFLFFRLSLIGCKNRRVMNILPLKLHILVKCRVASCSGLTRMRKCIACFWFIRVPSSTCRPTHYRRLAQVTSDAWRGKLNSCTTLSDEEDGQGKLARNVRN